MKLVEAPRLPDLVQLATTALPPCVSIYLPTARAGRETRGGATRLKNALREARQQAESAGLQRTADAVLEPAERLVDDAGFWQQQSDGLALLLAPGVVHTLRVPIAFEPAVVVADALHLRPLLPLADDLEFLVLACSQNRARLLRGSRWHIEEPDQHDLPGSLAAALWPDDPEKSLQLHGHRTPQGQAAVFHGHGTAGNAEKHKDDLARYFRALDEALRASPEANGGQPLVLACVDYCAAIYRSVSKHPHLAPETIFGNPDAVGDDELHAAAWRLLAPRLEARRAAAIAQYRAAAGTGLTADQLGEVVVAAQNGRVGVLFASAAEQRWGRAGADGATAPAVHDARQPGDVDLIDRATVLTLAQGGTVHAVDAATLPLTDGVAAIFRY